MKTVHRISVSSSPSVAAELAKLGVEVAPTGLVSFEIEESDPRWRTLEPWIKGRGAVDVPRTRFSSKELAATEWLALVPEWHHGYPQPDEDSFGYLRATYDLSNYCEECGSGLRQIAPFRMKAEPKWGRHSVLQMNWVFDEFFVRPEVWSQIFAPRGVSQDPVLSPQGQELRTVVQLVVEEKATMVTDGLVHETCGRCRRTRYVPVARGMLPPLTSTPNGAAAKTAQWFGSGARSYKLFLVDQSIRQAIVAGGIHGISFWPVSEAPAGRRSVQP